VNRTTDLIGAKSEEVRTWSTSAANKTALKIADTKSLEVLTDWCTVDYVLNGGRTTEGHKRDL
jgi:hypothetical protein